MKPYHSIYGPDLTEGVPLEEQRSINFSGIESELFLHIGHFTAWYASAEMMLTVLLHTFSGSMHPGQFHILTKGMDGKIKVERLKKLVSICGWEISDALKKRIDHFQNTIIPLRNSLMHSHLYWGADHNLQVTSIAAPPMIAGGVAGEAPTIFHSLELFERGQWLCLFARDLGNAFNNVHDPLSQTGTLGTGPLHSPLPTGHHPKTGPKASPARKHTQVQNAKRGG